MNNSVALPVTEYRVQTACGRSFIWAATSGASLLNELAIKGYSVLLAEPLLDGYEQQELNSELEMEVVA